MDWALKVDVLTPGTLGWVFESSLKGVAIDLPAPLGKVTGEEMPLRIEGRDEVSPPGTDFILASYGRVAQFAAHRTSTVNGASIDRVLVSLGRAIERSDAARAERPGLWMRGELPALNVDDWIAMLPRLGVAESMRQNPGLVLAGADFDVRQFDAMGARFTDLKLAMRETPKGWAFDVDGPEVAGTANWSAAERRRAQRQDRGPALTDLDAGSRQRRIVARRHQGRRRRRRRPTRRRPIRGPRSTSPPTR